MIRRLRLIRELTNIQLVECSFTVGFVSQMMSTSHKLSEVGFSLRFVVGVSSNRFETYVFPPNTNSYFVPRVCKHEFTTITFKWCRRVYEK